MLKPIKNFFFYLFILFCVQLNSHANSFELKWFNKQRKLFIKIDLKSQKVSKENTKTKNFDIIGNLTSEHPEITSLDCNYFVVNEFTLNKRNVISLIGTSLVYEFIEHGDQFQLKRLDNSSFKGYNFFAYQFVRKDTLFSLGGYGFWNYTNTLTFFDEKNKGWEIYKYNNDGPNEIAYDVAGYDQKNDGIWTLNFIKPEKIINGDTQQDLYFFNFLTKKWEHKGQINKELFDTYNCSTERAFWINNRFIFNKRESCIMIDPAQNKVYVSDLKNRHIGNGNEIIQAGNSIYLYRPQETNTFVKYQILKVKKDDFMKYFQKSDESFIEKPAYRSLKNWIYFFLLVVVGTASYMVIKKVRNNYSIFEDKELRFLQELVKNEAGLTTDELNEFLDIDKKNIDIQKNHRNLFIKNINAKFHIKYNGENLIERKSSENDKRFVNYVINPKHLSIVKTMI